MSLEPLLTPERLAERWGCSIEYVYSVCRSGALTAYKIGGWKIDPEDAKAFKESKRYQPPAPRRRPGPKPKPKYVTKGV